MNRLLLLLFLTILSVNTAVMRAQSPYETPTPSVTYELTEDALVVTALGEGTVTLYIQFIDNETGEMTTESIDGDGAVTYSVPRTFEDTYINFWATAMAWDGAYPGISETEYYVEVPALEVEPIYETPAPVVTWEITDDAMVITATGEGTVTLYVQVIDGYTGEMTTMTVTGEGTATYYVPRTEEYNYVNFWATAQAWEEAIPGISQTVYYIEVPPLEPIPPYETPAPEVTCELTEYALVVTATGEGMVTLYIQFIDNETGEMTTETYDGDGEVVVTLPRTEETYYINYWATAMAWEVNVIPGISQTEYFVEIPAKEFPPVVVGDIDGDGKVAISDVSALIDYLLSPETSSVNPDDADLDHNGSVTIADLSALIDYILSGTW